MDTKRIRAEIDLDAIEYNADAVLAKIPRGVKFLAVIKADAYGHGAVPIAHFLKNKADYYAVATVDEAMELRRSGIETPLLVLGYFSPDYDEISVRNHIQPVIFTEESARALSRAAEKLGMTAECHLSVDTGMSRIGFQPTEAAAQTIAGIAALPHLKINGIFSHFATADAADKTEALAQRKRFNDFICLLADKKINPPLKHLCNSAGIMEFGEYDDMVREGIILYGLYPSEEVNRQAFPLKPAMSLRSQVVNVQTLPAGRGISYGRTYITNRETVVATVPVGYADGYPRILSAKGAQVLIGGKRCPILGRVCMDQLMADVTQLPEVQVGDLVTLIGQDGEEAITADELAALEGSINYEVVCGLSKRVPRVYWKNGRVDSIYNALLGEGGC